MPQTDFFAEPNDQAMLVRCFLQLGFELVPELCYMDSNLTFIKDFDLYEKVRLDTLSYFLWHKDCTASPLSTFQVSGNGWNAGTFAIYHRQGGPTLHFVCHHPNEREGVHIVPAGLVSYYATYKNTITGKYEKIPAQLRSKYKTILKDIKREGHLVEFECLEGGTRRYWMLPAAYQAVREGAELGIQRLADLKVKGLEDVPWALRNAQ